MNRTLTRAVLAAVVAAVPLAGAPVAVADDSGAVEQRYVMSLVQEHRDAAAYSAMDDYVRTLVYWHEHPDWGLSR